MNINNVIILVCRLPPSAAGPDKDHCDVVRRPGAAIEMGKLLILIRLIFCVINCFIFNVHILQENKMGEGK